MLGQKPGFPLSYAQLYQGMSLVSHCPMLSYIRAWAWFPIVLCSVIMSGHKPGFPSSFVQLQCQLGFLLSFAQLSCQGINQFSHYHIFSYYVSLVSRCPMLSYHVQAQAWFPTVLYSIIMLAHKPIFPLSCIHLSCQPGHYPMLFTILCSIIMPVWFPSLTPSYHAYKSGVPLSYGHSLVSDCPMLSYCVGA